MILIKEDNANISALIKDIDKKLDIIRKEKLLENQPELEKSMIADYQDAVLPFLDNHDFTGIEMKLEDEEVLKNDLLEYMSLLEVIINSQMGDLDLSE